ncbi:MULTISPECIES: cytochrome P450 [unclassified Gordonia (in: high G+C Gram-positive bacteria)]|uniref:cytochrome P450 n=1 Tax=unclassified Gordonia (in: high G+C Gram-positive bacteria) TaxID=2657482 RepID=UPI001F0E6F88|nr:cytochrome P450 [Gordonia sp. ABSL49_1]MCH5645327.1 cytochrome P450 [Gordonia sp. ABSL49_1]
MTTYDLRTTLSFTKAPRRWHLAAADSPSGITGADDDAGPIDIPRRSARPVADEPAPNAPATYLRPNTLWTSLQIVTRQGDMFFADAAEHGDLLRYKFPGGPNSVAVLTNPSHIRSVMTADPDIAPSATRQSPLRPIVGPNSVLTSIGPRHRRQRTLLMPRFHGKSVAAYRESIETATATHIDSWPVGQPIRLADMAQQLTLDVIMAAVFGLPDGVPNTEAEHALRSSMVRMLRWSTHPLATVAQLANSFNENPVGITKLILRPVDAAIAALLAERRAESSSVERTDIAALLLAARTDDGMPLPDSEIRDELLTLVLAGHETTANTVAWTFERLTRNPDVYRDARDAARAGDDDYIEALLNESMRARPVVPLVARELLQPWQFGAYRVDPGTVALISILLLHHRDDIYPRPFEFTPERFLGVRPASHTLMPFGGGNRRCLGATLAMAELRIVVTEILRRVDLELTDRAPERPRHRNVTMISRDGGLVRANAIR